MPKMPSLTEVSQPSDESSWLRYARGLNDSYKALPHRSEALKIHSPWTQTGCSDNHTVSVTASAPAPPLIT
jgi:hypothetical protein